MSELILNARFLMRPATGVDRVAAELMQALDQIGLPQGMHNWRALRPGGTTVSTPAPFRDRLHATASRLDGHLWEQLILRQSCPDDWLLSLCNAGPVLRRRQIVMLHDAQVFSHPESYARAFRQWYRIIQPRLGHRAAMVLTVSEHARAQLEHFGVVPKGKARVVPNGADHILRLPADLNILTQHRLKPQGYFLAIGSQAAHKNIPMLLRAARTRNPDAPPLVIAGGGHAAAFAGASVLSSRNIRTIGRVSDAALRALYENATALVFPSLTEGFGLPPVEAMLCGCPVIASTGGAIPEVCGDAAFLVDPLDEKGWTTAMTDIADTPDLRNSLTQAGYKRAATFTWANAAAILSEHLSDLPKDDLWQG
jgi:glycosyltransferase involved in cell wall biosynthesis